MKKNFSNILIIFMMILLVGCFWQISSLKIELQNVKNNLSHKISNMEVNLMNNVSYIEESQKKEASILAKSEWNYGELNIQDYTVEIICNVTPKEYRPEHTTASIMFGDYEIPMELQNGKFVGKGAVSLFEETLVSKVLIYEDDTIQTEALDWRITPLYEYLPSVNAYLNGSSICDSKNGKHIWRSEGNLEIFIDQKSGSLSPESSTLIRCIDGKVVEKEELKLDGNHQNDESYSHTVDLEYEIPYGSKQELYVEIEDANGLHYRTLFEQIETDENGTYIDRSHHEIGKTTIYGKNGEELYRGFW